VLPVGAANGRARRAVRADLPRRGQQVGFAFRRWRKTIRVNVARAICRPPGC
jgi:hypothetical protein